MPASSAPQRSGAPRRWLVSIVLGHLQLGVSCRWGPARIAYRLRLQPSTVGKVLVRYQAPRLAWTDPATGARLRAKAQGAAV